MHDLLITGGLVVDGTGVPGRLADVAIGDGRITGIGRLAGEAAHRVIDAAGLVVAPGVVDAHTHYDPQITWDPLCDTAALHGVTTVAAGNCGFSVAPCRTDDHDYVAQVFARVEGMDPAALANVAWGFETFEEFLATRPGRLGVNLGMYVGHSAVRRWVMGDAVLRAGGDRRRDRRHGRHRHRGDGRGGVGVVVVARAHPPRHGRPPGAQPAGHQRRAAGPRRRPGALRAREHRLRPAERGRGHRRRRP